MLLTKVEREAVTEPRTSRKRPVGEDDKWSCDELVNKGCLKLYSSEAAIELLDHTLAEIPVL